MEMPEIEAIVNSVKLEQGRGMVRWSLHASAPPRANAARAQGKQDKSDLSHEAVWGITAEDGSPVVIITTPVTKKFAVSLLYQGAPTAKPKVDFVVDSKLGDNTKLQAMFEMLQARLTALASDAIPNQSTNAYWKGKPAKIEENLPKLLKPGKQYAKDGVSGQYDPSFTLSVKVPNEEGLTKLSGAIAAYELPPYDSISKGYNDSIETYAAALRKMPPLAWDIKVRDAKGETVSNNVLLEKRSIVAQVMFQLDSLMIKPLKTLSIQMPIRQMYLCDVASNKRRLEDADLDALWKAPAPKVARVAEEESGGAGAGASYDDDY